MRDFVLTVVVIALLPACVTRPWIGALAWAWLGFMNPHKQAWGFARGLPFAEMVAIATLIGLVLVPKDRKAPPWTPEMVLLLVFMIFMTITTMFAWVPDMAWLQWDKVVKIVFFTFIMSMLIYGRYRIIALLTVIVLSLSYYGVKGGIFTVTTGGAFMVMGPEGTFIGSNTALGLALIMVLPMTVFLARQATKPWMRRSLYAIAVLCTLSTVFTYSRGALLGLAAILPLMFLRTRKKFLILLLIVPLGYFGKDLVPQQLYDRAQTIENYQEDTSAMLRLQAWSVAWNVAKENPWFGAGYNFDYSDDDRWLSYANFLVEGAENYARAAHSIYFQILGHHGFLGLFLFILLIIGTLLRLRKIRKEAIRHADTQWIAGCADAIQLGLIGYLVAGAFLSLAYFDLFYTYVALSAILHRELHSAAMARVETQAPSRGELATEGRWNATESV